MSSLSDYINVKELQEIVRLYAHRLLLGYEETHEEEFWFLSEKMAEIYECLGPFVSSQQTKIDDKKFPNDYWFLSSKTRSRNIDEE